LVTVKQSFGEALDDIAAQEGCRPKTVVTTARRDRGNLTCHRLHQMLDDGISVVLAFGTAWGLTGDFMATADYTLDPLTGPGRYNHMSVRSAVAIILDRLLGNS
jgi:hypothetical protein